jgi:hypothetical protein
VRIQRGSLKWRENLTMLDGLPQFRSGDGVALPARCEDGAEAAPEGGSRAAPI